MFTSTPSHHDDDNNDVREQAESLVLSHRGEEKGKKGRGGVRKARWRYLEHKHFDEEHAIVR